MEFLTKIICIVTFIFLILHYKKMFMQLKKSDKKKYLTEYKKILLYSPYDELLIDVYESSKPRFKTSKNGKIISAKRKSYNKIVNEFILEISNNFEKSINDSEESLNKINDVINNVMNDFSSLNYEAIMELAKKLTEESWIDTDTFTIK